ncbi:DUF1593-domain-containing protein [Aaosphaeria arxii CBS 175.79]|uniref:DUF1593-domain-containing protein n=1 Tax=Aaosphaeria arxii CBS 175.79 TaxID=1450172 RepID=A0A6A5XIF2_9PLEO|nr:DUF1593-domain-containing protein [Aaosphaeria arxii CBS 175.79]KAF2012733.1 DUF1593-domain-containing protein [Aaosphaeria arxii CBS 175.79]
MTDPKRFRLYKSRPRTFIISDISNEPDDAESLVRYLLYANELDTRGLVACTSTHMKNRTCPQDMESIIEGFGKVVHNLNKHVHSDNAYPDASHLLALVKSGPEVYGKLALEPGVALSEGTNLLIERVDESEEPLWILCWGGTNVLAQALQHVRASRSSEDCTTFYSKLRVYAISDQDDTGLWIRIQFPQILYICSIHGWSQYSCATWMGISGDVDRGGADTTKVSKQWLRENIQLGPLGQKYPDLEFIMEGDTPTFLYLIQNGLSAPEHPEWGSWGGRYDPVDLALAGRHYADTTDTVFGLDGRSYTSNFATIWRWRDAYQNDFAARLQWTLTDNISKANHAPVVIVNGSDGSEHLEIDVEAGETVTLDASESYDPDNNELTFRWFQYKEVSVATGLIPQQIPDIDMRDIGSQRTGSIVEITAPLPGVCAVDMLSGEPTKVGHSYHLILEVKDNGTPPLVAYKRVVLRTLNSQLKGRRSQAVHTSSEWIKLGLTQ